MAKGNLVNLDALIKRADFGLCLDEEEYESFNTMSLRDFTKGSLIIPNIRKPDFQRETNHWSPIQVLSLLESFVNGDLIPSVILWKSPTYLFVIDGGHRLSVLRAWVEDDYGDGALSHEYFNRNIPLQQKKIAEKTRNLINNSIGSYKQLELKNDNPNLPDEERKIVSKMISRILQVQWVKGDADKAEQSFFKINTQGTPLDSIEQILLENRRKPIPICARAIIRAGTGHKYWSKFSDEIAAKLETEAKDFHQTLFEPELKRPIKTLDLPLGGAKGVRDALQLLIDFLLITNRGQTNARLTVTDYDDDSGGSETLAVLGNGLKLASTITGNTSGSLGLHPAIYFYGPSGRHSRAMFLGVVSLFSKKLSNNDKRFFSKFTEVRAAVEDVLITKKDLIAAVLQKHISKNRINIFSTFMEDLINHISNGNQVADEDIVKMTKLEGKIVLGTHVNPSVAFNADTKSRSFIKTALSSGIKCPICNGFLDPEKSVSYDHIVERSKGGLGSEDNCQLTHPYCNQSIKNQ